MGIHIHTFHNNTGGINMNAALGSMQDNEAETIVNMHLTQNGAWSTKDIGYRLLNSNPLNDAAQVNGITQYQDAAGTVHTVVFAGSRAYRFNLEDGTFTEIGAGFGDTDTVSSVVFKDQLIMCSRSLPPMKWQGGAMSALAGWPPTIAGVTVGSPTLSEVFTNRLVLAGDSLNPSMLYISELENPNSFTPSSGPLSAGAIQISPGDGDQITGLKTLYLPMQNEEVLVIFKARAIYLLLGHDADAFTVQKLSGAIGAVSGRTVVQLGNDLLFLSENGISTITTVTLEGNIASATLSEKLTPLINTFNKGLMPQAFAVHLPERQEVWWWVAQDGATSLTTVLVYNYSTGRGIWSLRANLPATCAMTVNGGLYTGTNNGMVQQQLYGNSYNGQAIQWTYRTPFYALGNPRQTKRIREIEICMTQYADAPLTLTGAWDNARSVRLRRQRNLTVFHTPEVSLYDTAIYGQNTYDEPGITRRRVAMEGAGQTFQMELGGAQTTMPIEIQGWSITTINGGLRTT